MKMTLRTKILLACAVPMAAILLLIAAVLVNTFYTARLDSTRKLMSASVAFQASRIDAENRLAGEVAASMALAQVNGMFGDRAATLGFLRDVLESTPQATGVFLSYAPDADGADASMPLPGVSADALGASGRFVPYWARSSEDPQSLSLRPDSGMESKHYYRALQNLVQGRPAEEGIQIKGGISRQYREKTATGSGGLQSMVGEPRLNQGRLIIRQSSPIVIDGVFKGVAGVERSLDSIAESLRSERVLASAEYILISTRGRVIVATMDSALEGLPIEDTPYADLLGRLYRESRIDELTILADPHSGEERLFAATEVPTGDWHLLMSVSMDEVAEPVRKRGLQVLIAFLAGVLIAVLLAMALVRKVIQRVEDAASAVTRVADGDLSLQVDSAVSDESGQILRAIGNMVRSLDALIGRIKGSSLELVSAATDISAAAQKQRDVSSDFGASTSEIAASTNEITATSRELLETMTQVSRATADTAGVANRGRTDLERMESTMQQLATATNSISAKLAVISERANKIGAVVTTITKVAEQTNLLSLNAAIEAEKAGEYGLGFSVVAREIRRLADQTAVATLDIERIVGEMQSSVSSGVMEMDRFDEQVREGVREAVRLGEQMAVIIEGVENLRPRFETAQQSMQSQVVGAGQINEAMMQLREVAMASGASSDGLNAAAAQMLAAVESLRAEVARFRTAGR